MKEAGLPNITGSTGKTFTGNDTGLVAGGNGCFGATKTYNALYPVEIGNGVYSGGSICISFDASFLIVIRFMARLLLFSLLL